MWLARPSLRRDIAVAGLVTALLVVGTSRMGAEPGDRAPDFLAYACVGVAGTALLVRQRWPLGVLAIVTAALVLYGVRAYPGGPVYAAGALALFSYARTTDRRRAAGAGALVGAMLFAALFLASGEADALGLLMLGWAAVAVLGADALRSAAERREQETRRRIIEDRLRIARDVHDSVGHALTAINVQAAVAAHLAARDQGQTLRALEAVRVASRDGLIELAGLLDVLHERAVPRAPAPNLTRLDDLVASAAVAGVEVELRRTGELVSVPVPVSTAAYRIVQEALTNVVRHAGTARAEVAVAVAPEGGVVVDVRDEGRGGAPEGGGRGLDGIRERAAATGGAVEVGPRMGGGFAVRAQWP